MKKTIIIVIGIVFLGFIGRCVYMIACISCTTLPIKVYEYSGSMNQFESEFKKFAYLNPDIKYQITRRGNNEFDARDLVIKIKNTHTTNIIYSLGIRDFNGTTEILLDAIWDESHKIGGNSTDDPNVKQLFAEFKKKFLPRM